ncbi:GNAT family N-acetyltransferase [Novosphingobium sp. RD2P27]|uniref:GNAT family N-acetyltransferase n=1 Tax=Novosphingobium kalidii TaxID=3230299 RepID=A0ABV2CY52_9SPHN
MAENEQSRTMETRSGLSLHVRPVSSDDGPLLRAFFAKVTTDDLRFRFLSCIHGVSDDQIAMMTDVDHKGTEDFLAFKDDGTLVATAMVAKDDSGKRAEVAIVVRADYKQKGIGWAMLNMAADYSRATGAERLESVESRQNTSALSVERDLGFSVKPYNDDPTLVIVTKELV